jgi:hypothetical protein
MGAPEHIAGQFERFNVYAKRASKMDDNADINSNLAVAFEIGQLRYQLTQIAPPLLPAREEDREQ